MNVIKTPLEGLLILEPTIHKDSRGYFFESYNQQTFQKDTGLDLNFVQDNQAYSERGVIRGLHYQNPPYGQTKLIRVLQGVVWDVVVDIRQGSATYGQWFGIELSEENKRQFLIPEGFAHGYSVLSEKAEIFYKCTNYYNKASEGGMSYADPSLNIDWKVPADAAIVSEKDLQQPLLKDANSAF